MVILEGLAEKSYIHYTMTSQYEIQISHIVAQTSVYQMKHI